MKRGVFIVVVALLFSGCFKNEPPACSDPQVKDDVKKIYKNIMEKMKKNAFYNLAATMLKVDHIYPDKILGVRDAVEQEYDQNLKLRKCKAEVVFDNKISLDIDYTVRLDKEDPDYYIVELDPSFFDALYMKSVGKIIQAQSGDKNFTQNGESPFSP